MGQLARNLTWRRLGAHGKRGEIGGRSIKNAGNVDVRKKERCASQLGGKKSELQVLRRRGRKLRRRKGGPRDEERRRARNYVRPG